MEGIEYISIATFHPFLFNKPFKKPFQGLLQHTIFEKSNFGGLLMSKTNRENYMDPRKKARD